MNKVEEILSYIDDKLILCTNEEAQEILEDVKSEIESRIDLCEDGVYTEN